MSRHDTHPHGTGPEAEADLDMLLAGHALGDLDEPERHQLAALLQQRPELRQRLDEFSTTLELLPLALPAAVGPPQRLRQRLLDQRPPRHGVGPWLLPALMGLGLLVLGAQLHQTRQQLARVQQQAGASGTLTSASRELPLQAIGGEGDARGMVLVTGNPTHNMLMLDGLSPPPPNTTYRLWARVNGREVGCVPFVPDGKGHVAMPIPTFPTSAASSVSVSIEPLGALGAQPGGRRVLGSTI
jgi:hypothetical protein